MHLFLEHLAIQCILLNLLKEDFLACSPPNIHNLAELLPRINLNQLQLPKEDHKELVLVKPLVVEPLPLLELDDT